MYIALDASTHHTVNNTTAGLYFNAVIWGKSYNRCSCTPKMPIIRHLGARHLMLAAQIPGRFSIGRFGRDFKKSCSRQSEVGHLEHDIRVMREQRGPDPGHVWRSRNGLPHVLEEAIIG